MLVKVKCAFIGLFALGCVALGCGGYDPTLLVPDGGVDHALRETQETLLASRVALDNLSGVVRDCHLEGLSPATCDKAAQDYAEARSGVVQAYNQLQKIIDAKTFVNGLQGR